MTLAYAKDGAISSRRKERVRGPGEGARVTLRVDSLPRP
jgi:hypothetical protein